MADDLVVDFGVSGVADLVKTYRETADTITSMVKPLQQIARSMKLIDERSGRFAMHMMVAASAINAMAGVKKLPSPGGGGGGGSRGGGQPPDPLVLQARSMRNQASYLRAQQSLARAMNPTAPGGRTPKAPPSFGQALKNAIFSTRFTANSGHLHLMPLIGRTMQVLTSLGPIGVAAAGATVAIGALGAIAHTAAEMIGGLVSAKNIAGGTYGEAGKAAGLGAALGMSATDIAGMAMDLAEQLATNPYAMGHGLSDPLGNNPMSDRPDKFKNFFVAVDQILDTPNDADALRLARSFGPNMVKILDLRNMSPEIRDRLLKGLAFGPAEAHASADFSGTTGLLKLEFDKLLIASTPLIDIFTIFLSVMVDLVSAIGGMIKWMNDQFDQAMDNGFGADMGMRGKSGGKNGNPETAQSKHTDALNRNTDALYAQLNLSRQVFGGGGRAAGAVPANFRGNATVAMNLGAFAL